MSGSAQVDWHPGAPALAESFQWVATFSPNGVGLFTAPGNGRILAIIGRPEILESGAATVQVVKAPSGTTIAAGTAVCPTMNVGTGATARVPQNLLQWGAVEALTINAGDTIGFVTSGTITASAANISVYWAPQ